MNFTSNKSESGQGIAEYATVLFALIVVVGGLLVVYGSTIAELGAHVSFSAIFNNLSIVIK